MRGTYHLNEAESRSAHDVSGRAHSRSGAICGWKGVLARGMSSIGDMTVAQLYIWKYMENKNRNT